MSDPLKGNEPAKPEVKAEENSVAKQTQEIVTQLTEQLLKPQQEQLKNVQEEQARQREQLAQANRQAEADRAAAADKAADEEWQKWAEWMKKDPAGAMKELSKAQLAIIEKRSNEIADQKFREMNTRQAQSNETITKFLEANKTKWDELRPEVDAVLKKYPGQAADNPLVLETAMKQLQVRKLEEAKEPPAIPPGTRGSGTGGVGPDVPTNQIDPFKAAVNIKSPADL